MRKDYYKILGVTDDEKKLQGEEFEKVLKKKFRKIALEFHPDRQNGKSENEKKKAEEKFKEASEAYEVLSDSSKRQEYDNPQSRFEFHSSGGPDFGGMSMDDILRHLNMGMGMDFGFSTDNHRNATVKGTSIRIPFKLTLEEMYNGVTKKIRYKRFELCGHCGGSGMTSESKKKTCRTCGGSGNVFSGGLFGMVQTCPTCGGNGYIIENPCPYCKGHGVVQKTVETEIKLEKGILNGMSIIFSGKGNFPPHGNGTVGDLIVQVIGKPHEKFEAVNNDLYFKLSINIADAVLGKTIELNTVDGRRLTAKIPQGTSDGHKIRFRGYGLPYYGKNGNGDMIGVIQIEIPKSINDNEKKLLEALREEEHFKF